MTESWVLICQMVDSECAAYFQFITKKLFFLDESPTFLPRASEEWGKVIFSVCLSVHTRRGVPPSGPDGRNVPPSFPMRGYPNPVLMGGTPILPKQVTPHWDWMGAPPPSSSGLDVPPPVRTGWIPPLGLHGYPPNQDRMGYPPPTIRTEWVLPQSELDAPPPPSRLDGVPPSPCWDWMGYPPPPSGLDGGTPPPPPSGLNEVLPLSGLDAPHQDLMGHPPPPPRSAYRETEQLCGRRYASCVHAGGLSCL